MKKFMLILFVLVGFLGYSDAKCELKARTIPERMIHQTTAQAPEIEGKYRFTGVDKKNKNLYYYLMTFTRSDGKELEYYTVVNVKNGEVFIQNLGENQKLQKFSGNAFDAVCK